MILAHNIVREVCVASVSSVSVSLSLVFVGLKFYRPGHVGKMLVSSEIRDFMSPAVRDLLVKKSVPQRGMVRSFSKFIVCSDKDTFKVIAMIMSKQEKFSSWSR